tara:strand:- start:95 stop:1069 length:975 start_codon:yes stop_codon:yes gene_type:complete
MTKILVTGATGFIGSHLVELLVSRGHDVIAFDRYNPNNHWGWLENSKYKNDIEVVLGDIRDFDSVYKTMKNCNTVIHLAALGGIPYSYISPLAYIRTNIEGTYNVLESSKSLDLENILVTSTSEVYGTAQYTPIDEKHPLNGQSPYSATKIGADQLSISYYQSFDLPVKIVRPFNTYGPRQSARAIIPSIIIQILNGAKELNLGNLTPTRDLTYVDDTCTGIYKILNNMSLIGKTVNIGMNKEISITDLLDKILKLMSANITINIDKKRIRPEKSEVDRLLCDNSLIISSTDWRPKYSLDSGLKNTIDWLTDNIEKYKPNIYNV